MIPHPDKKAKGGEDACLVKKNLMIVADGVGGWSNEGIDSGIYSRTLVKNMKEIFFDNEMKYTSNLKKLI